MTTYTRADLARELVTLGDIARSYWVPVDNLHKWRERYAHTFPRPVATTAGGAVYIRSEVEEWLRQTGRLQHPQDAQHDQ